MNSSSYSYLFLFLYRNSINETRYGWSFWPTKLWRTWKGKIKIGESVNRVFKIVNDWIILSFFPAWDGACITSVKEDLSQTIPLLMSQLYTFYINVCLNVVHLSNKFICFIYTCTYLVLSDSHKRPIVIVLKLIIL